MSSNELNPQAVKFAEQVKEAINITVENNEATATIDKKFFVNNLPAGLTEESVRQLKDYTVLTSLAGTLAFGEKLAPVLAKDKDIKSGELVIPMTGRDKVVINIPRESSQRNPSTGESKTVYGRARIDVEHYGLQKSQDLTNIRGHLNELFEKSLNKKEAKK